MRTLPGWWSVLVGTATVTAQGALVVDPSTRSGDFYLATTGDLEPATSGDFLMAMDKTAHRFALRSPFGQPSRHVGPRPLIRAHADEHDAPERAVRLPVAAPVQA